MSKIRIKKNGCYRTCEASKFASVYEPMGYILSDLEAEAAEAKRIADEASLVDTLKARIAELEGKAKGDAKPLEDYKGEGGWYAFPDGKKEQGDSAEEYYEANKGNW